MLDGPQSLSGCRVKEEIPYLHQESYHNFSATTLSL
jgi:hypothetical protein